MILSGTAQGPDVLRRGRTFRLARVGVSRQIQQRDRSREVRVLSRAVKVRDCEGPVGGGRR